MRADPNNTITTTCLLSFNRRAPTADAYGWIAVVDSIRTRCVLFIRRPLGLDADIPSHGQQSLNS